jgi:hypothetical protein
VSAWWTPVLYPIRHYPVSIWKVDLVEDKMLGKVFAQSIWQCYRIRKSAATAYHSRNPLGRSIFCGDEYHSYLGKGNYDCNLWGYLGQPFCMSGELRSTAKYPSLVIPGYIYSVKGKTPNITPVSRISDPMIAPSYEVNWLASRGEHHCNRPLYSLGL